MLFGLQSTPEKDLRYLVFRDEQDRSYLFVLNEKTGQIIATNRIETPTAPLYFSSSQKLVYWVSGITNPVLSAYSRS